ncbi:MAG TPA: ectonucleotide pyrophosphatase/phosphodiesterase [Blastocatellia bacterium]|nr:ectonucleotide pyrophosphatase/phosphodiesterase [Blastocatellia bacterium]
MKRNKTLGLQFLLVFAFLLLILSFASCVDRDPIAKLQPTIILISIDGFRSDYLAKYEPPILGSLAREGVQAKWMTASFPTKTFPNHYAIVTGLYPQNNGIVENSVYDTATKTTFGMDNRAEVQSSSWWLGEPIWVTAEKQGQRAAPFFWPGSEAEIEGKRATYWIPYDGAFPNDARVDQVLTWLDLPPTERPTFLTLYFADVDHAGHEFTPDATETRDAVLKVDEQFGRLIDGLKARQFFEQVNLIVVSDHGMATQDPHNAIILDEAFNTNLAEKVVWTSEIVSIFPKEGSEDAIYNSLKAKLPPQARVYRKSQTPARLHYSNSPRIAPLLVLPDEGWVLITRKRFEERKAKGDLNLRGGHGYDNELASMRATFIARGPAFKKGAVIDPFENIQIYNMMAKILGLAPAPNDGDDTLIKSALAEPSIGSYRP